MRICNGRVCPCTQVEEQYVRIDGYMVYLRDQTTRTPSLANPPIQTTLPDTPFLAPLHGILTKHCPTLRYGYVYGYGYIYDPVHFCRRHYHCKHCTAASRDRPPSHQVSDTSPVIGSSFAGHSFRFYQTQLWFRFDQTHLFLSIRFDSHITYLFLTRVTQFESHFSKASVIPTLARVSQKYSDTKIVEYSIILII